MERFMRTDFPAKEKPIGYPDPSFRAKSKWIAWDMRKVNIRNMSEAHALILTYDRLTEQLLEPVGCLILICSNLEPWSLFLRFRSDLGTRVRQAIENGDAVFHVAVSLFLARVLGSMG
jgi:hypothetical protein